MANNENYIRSLGPSFMSKVLRIRLSEWVEGTLQTGINSTIGVGEWFNNNADGFQNWDNMVSPLTIQCASFAVHKDLGSTPFNPPESE